jgi:serine/threonine-protein kinase
MNIGRYQVVRMLGQGGMASVYEGCETSLNRRVAIKVLHAELGKDSDVITRFVSEGRIVNGIRHPSLVPVHEQGQLPDGSYYIVMELLEGETLSKRLQRSVHRPLSLEEVLRLGRQVTEALATVHRHGVVHRDIKPPPFPSRNENGKDWGKRREKPERTIH